MEEIREVVCDEGIMDGIINIKSISVSIEELYVDDHSD